MSLNDRTKEYYVEALETLLQQKPFEKIQVKDLCEYCNTTRTTFYYHFRDKYGLVAWIFNRANANRLAVRKIPDDSRRSYPIAIQGNA